MTSTAPRTSVFIERIAPNAAMLHPHPQEHASAVCDLLTRLGWAASLVGPEKPVRGGVLFFDGSEFDDAVLGDLADALNDEADAGVAAYAYECVEAIGEDGDPALVFRRVGSHIPKVGNGVLLTHTYLFDDMATTWLYGAAQDLMKACVAIDAGVTGVRILPVHSGPRLGGQALPPGVHPGLDAVEIRHLSPILDSEEAVDIARDVVDALIVAGLSGPIILTDHRQGEEPDSARLEARY